MILKLIILLGVLITSNEACHPEVKRSGGSGNQNGAGQSTTTTTVPTTPAEKYCEDGWTKVEREKGSWCIQIFQEDVYTYSNGEKACNQYGSVLSSVETKQELKTIANLMPSNMNKFFLIGGKPVAKCSCSANTVTCNKCKFEDAFDWTDNFVTGKKALEDVSTGYEDTLLIDGFGAIASNRNTDLIKALFTPYVVCGKKAT